jgi:hypothetical protein
LKTLKDFDEILYVCYHFPLKLPAGQNNSSMPCRIKIKVQISMTNILRTIVANTK